MYTLLITSDSEIISLSMEQFENVQSFSVVPEREFDFIRQSLNEISFIVTPIKALTAIVIFSISIFFPDVLGSNGPIIAPTFSRMYEEYVSSLQSF